MEQRVALVTAIGSFSAEAVVQGLHDQGVRVVGVDVYPREWVAQSLFVDSFRQAPFASSEAEYSAFVREVCTSEGVGLLLPLTDVEVDFFNAHRDLLADLGTKVLISPASALALCRDKRAMAEFLKGSKSGVRGIPTVPLAPLDGRYPGHPVVVKPLDGRSSQGLTRVRGPEDWRAVCPPGPERYIVQPLVEGPVVTVDVVRDQCGSAVVAVPRRELLRTPNGAGTSVRMFHDDALVAACQGLADELGVVGCVNFEFIEEAEGAYRFLECNPRFSGGVKFSCMAAYDCVANHLRAHLGEPIAGLGEYEDCFIARRYSEFVTSRP